MNKVASIPCLLAALAVLPSLAVATARAEVEVHVGGSFGEPGGKHKDFPSEENPENQNVTRDMASIDHSYDYGESYSVRGEALSRTISYFELSGPDLYVSASTQGGLIGAGADARAIFDDTVRVTGLENVPTSYYANLFLDLRFDLYGEVQGLGSIDISAGLHDKIFDPPASTAGSTYSFSLKGAGYDIHIPTYEEFLKAGVGVGVDIYANALSLPGQSSSASFEMSGRGFYFALVDANGNIAPISPAPIRVESTRQPGRIYPTFPNQFATRGSGDYNGDLVVDAADYVRWRQSLGDSVALGATPDGYVDGTIDYLDYHVWRSKFGTTVSGTAVATSFDGAVPEPVSLLLFVVAVLYHHRLLREVLSRNP